MAVEGGGQVAVEDGRMEMVVEEGGGSGGAEVSVEEVEVAVEGRWRGGGEGGGARRHQSSSPCSRPPKLNNPTSADHSPHPTWSKILLRNRASSAQSSTKLCISIRPAFKYSP